MLRNFFALSIAVFSFLFLTVLPLYAANLEFNPDSVDVQKEDTFAADIVIDAGSDQIAGTDVYVDFDPQYIELQSVTNGSYFPKTDNNPQNGRVYISGVIENQGEYKTGNGIVASLTFKAVKNGNTTIRYDCNLANTETSKIVKNDINATNVINCGGNGNLLVNIGSAGNSDSDSNSDNSSSSSDNDQLPQSGVYENVLKYAVPGMILLVIGAGLRLIVR